MTDASSKRHKRWLWWLILPPLLIWAGDFGAGLLIQHSRLKRSLTARLETAFGRPVVVGRYGLHLFPAPRLEAESITVGEDPRFGQEYFLRAQALGVSLRWQALVRGRLEFGTLSFTQPSLNLVRGPDGRWNLENWLPHPPSVPRFGAASGSASPTGATPHLQRIEVDGGRINFKRGADKLPFALVGVSGRVEQESNGRWRLDLDARPMRAAVIVQDAGIVHLQGTVGGTTFRLRPADLQLAWQDASLSDILRLLRGYDYGLRGRSALLLVAHSDGPQWAFQASAQFRRLHRWDLPLRLDDPLFNLNFAADWWPADSRIELKQALLEAPRSNVRASGGFFWDRQPGHPEGPAKDSRFRIWSSSIRLDDFLSWLRAFHPGIADELALSGRAGVDLNLSGWPPRIERGVVTTEGAQLEGGSLAERVRISPAAIRISPDAAQVAPVTITFGRTEGTLRLEASAHRLGAWFWDVKTSGQAEEVQDLIQAAGAFGWNMPQGWAMEGPAKFELRWQGSPRPFGGRPVGKVELGGTLFRAPFLNRPVSQVKARIELRPEEEKIRLDAAQAFGARWSGSLSRAWDAFAWNFSLAADRITVANLDRWLNPQWRQSLLERVLPMLESSSPSETLPAAFEARGQLAIGEVELAPVAFQHLRADAAFDSRHMQLTNAQVDFYGGALHGSFRASFPGAPLYHIEARLDRVHLVDLLAATASLRNKFAGTASAELELTARGLGRQALLSSLEGRGKLEVRDAEIRGFDLVESLHTAIAAPGTSSFPLAAGSFTIGAGKISFSSLRFSNSGDELEAAGTVGFPWNLDVRIQILPPMVAENPPATPVTVSNPPPGAFHLTGTLDSPQFARASR
jgi:hypothetical protein